MKYLRNAKFFLKSNMFWCANCNCSNSSKNNPDKTCFTLPKNECTRKAWIPAINRKESTLSLNFCLCSDYFQEACFDKSWTLEAHLFYTLHPKKRKLTVGQIPTISPTKK